jgi:hypothetical protein
MASSTSKQTSGARGTKIVRATGLDHSSYGNTGVKWISNEGFKGSRTDISSSIKGGKVREY